MGLLDQPPSFDPPYRARTFDSFVGDVMHEALENIDLENAVFEALDAAGLKIVSK